MKTPTPQQFGEILENHGFSMFGYLGFPSKIKIVKTYGKSFNIHINENRFSIESLYHLHRLLVKTYKNKLVGGSSPSIEKKKNGYIISVTII